MNIFFLTETESGCYKWRTEIPARYLGARGHRIQLLNSDAHQSAPDVMVFFRAHFEKAIEIEAWCKSKGIRTIFDTDDAIDLVPEQNLNFKLLQPRLPVYHHLLRSADLVTTTTETLAAHLRKSNPNVRVLPNSVDPAEWHPQPRGKNLRIGWSGSPSHFADLNLVLDAVRDLQKKYPFTFVLQGLCKENTIDELYQNLLKQMGKRFFDTLLGRTIKRFREKLSGIQHEFHPGVRIGEHAQKVCDLALDIGIAPLEENRFNSNKSCIKFYEYAMSGAVTVASRVLPYSEEVNLTVKNNRDAWKEKLETVINADRETLLREQREWVLTHRNIQKSVTLWERAYSGEISAPASKIEIEKNAALQSA